MRVANEAIHAALEIAEPTSIRVFGRPGPVLQEALRGGEELGVRVCVMPQHLGGLIRYAAA